MQKSDIIRLRHMFDAAKEAVSFIQEEEKASLELMVLMAFMEMMTFLTTDLSKGELRNYFLIKEFKTGFWERTSWSLPVYDWETILKI